MAAPWSGGNIAALLNILRDNNVISQLESARRNDFIYKQVAAKMVKASEYNFTAQQVRAKVKSLKRAYKSGSFNETCPFFEDMDELWGNRPTAAPPLFIDSSLLEVSLLPCSNVENSDDNSNTSCGIIGSFPISNPICAENLADAHEAEPSTSSSESNSRLENESLPNSTQIQSTFGKKRKFEKLEWAKDLMNKFEEHSSKQMKEFLEIQFKHENETLSKWMRFEEERELRQVERELRQQDHELRVLELLMKK